MKYINEYLETVLKIKPIGRVTIHDTDYYVGVKVLIDGKDIGIHLTWKDYAEFLENKTWNVREWHTHELPGNGQLG